MIGVELGLRLLGLGFGSSPMEPDPVLHHVHPKNYVFRQLHPSRELGGFDTYYDASGRVVANFAPPPAATPSDCRIAIMGDSFTEGGQVRFEESWAGRLTAAAKGACEVRNYGVRSYSPAIYLVQWTTEVRQWKPTHVFLLLFGNDVREDVNYLATSVTGPDGFPTAIQGPAGGWLFSALRRSYIARFGNMVITQAQWAWDHHGEPQWTIGGVVEENPEWPGKTDWLVAEINRRITADHTQLTVMVVPSRYRLMGDGKIPVKGDFHQSVKDWSATQGITFLDLWSPFSRAATRGVQLFYIQDIHFNGDGHALTAATIARAHPELFPHWKDISGASVQAAFGDQPAPPTKVY